MNKSKKFVYYGFPFVHHKNTMGGYHHIKDFIHYDLIIDLQSQKYFFDVTLKKNIFFQILRKIYLSIFGRIGFLELIRCSYLAIFKKKYIFHFV